MTTLGIPEAQRMRGIVACIAASTTVTVTLGITLPYLALVLEHQGVSPLMNGLERGGPDAGGDGPGVPGAPADGTFGVKRVIAAGMIGMALSLALLPLFPNVWAWFPIRFALGLSAELVYRRRHLDQPTGRREAARPHDRHRQHLPAWRLRGRPGTAGGDGDGNLAAALYRYRHRAWRHRPAGARPGHGGRARRAITARASSIFSVLRRR